MPPPGTPPSALPTWLLLPLLILPLSVVSKRCGRLFSVPSRLIAIFTSVVTLDWLFLVFSWLASRRFDVGLCSLGGFWSICLLLLRLRRLLRFSVFRCILLSQLLGFLWCVTNGWRLWFFRLCIAVVWFFWCWRWGWTFGRSWKEWCTIVIEIDKEIENEKAKRSIFDMAALSREW